MTATKAPNSGPDTLIASEVKLTSSLSFFHGRKAELRDEDNGGDEIDPTEDDGNGRWNRPQSYGAGGEAEHSGPNSSAYDQTNCTPEGLLFSFSFFSFILFESFNNQYFFDGVLFIQKWLWLLR